MKKEKRYQRIINYFQKQHPNPTTELQYETPYQLIVAVILSAQCTDKRVNKTTPAFFKSFPTPQKLADATFQEVKKHIKSITYPNSKTKRLIKMAQTLQTEFDGQIPKDAKSLQKLPGVGRKSAHVITATLHDKPHLAVDTHVFRVAERLGLTQNASTPLQTEKQITKYVPDHLIPNMHHWLILHGRYTCKARKPKCGECALTEVCKYYQKQVSKTNNN